MNKKWCPLLLIAVLFFGSRGFAQSPVSVNLLTGQPSVVIPVYNIARGAVSCPISIVYSSSGMKPKDVEGTAGMGWQLQAGGSVSRVVRGLPDDAYEDNAGNKNLIGWLYNIAGVAGINGFNIANAGTGLSCTNETNDVTYITANFSYLTDTEPDLFYVSAPGLSCQLFYDNANQKFVTVPYQDLAISYTTNTNSASAGFKQITSFTITNDHGIKYVFSVPESATQIATVTTGTTVNFFKSTYNQYKNGINYYDNWYLKSMTDINGNGLVFNYTAGTPRNSTDPVELYIGGSTTQTLEYKVANAVIPQLLSNIQTVTLNSPSQVFTFNWNTAGTSGQTMISSITGTGKNLLFFYNSALFTGSWYSRNFLSGFLDEGACGSPVNFQFSYNGVTENATTLPDSSSTQVDYWGYYSTNPANGSLLPQIFAVPSGSGNQRYQICASATNSGYTYTLPGTNRAADPTVIATGALSQIVNATGGGTTIAYEPNDFYDPTAGSVVTGGGIRVKQLTDFDGVSTANNIVRNFSYLNPGGTSSGKPVSLPVYAFTIPYSGTATNLSLWENATAVSATDLSPEDHTIMYEYATSSETGAGSTQYQYYLPATNWDNSAAPICCSTTTDWTPTVNYAARTNCTASYGPVQNDIYSYPFSPNFNYAFERGLVKKVTTYNDSHAEVSELNYTYQRTGTPNSITAFKYDESTNGSSTIKAYAKYKIYTSANELITQVVKKVFDLPALTQSQSSTTTYTYGNAQHKLTQEQVVNSDNKTLITNIKYLKDYNTGGGTDPDVIAIYNLQQLNVNEPVESYQQLQSGATTLTTAAALTVYQPFIIGGSTLYLPSQQRKFTDPVGVSNFQPFAINAGLKSYDSRYYPVANYTAYDNSGILQTMDDANHNEQTILTDHISYLPAVVFKNATAGEAGFTDFDSALPASTPGFSISGSSSVAVTGSHTGNAYGLSTAQTVSGTFTKNTLANNYIFSIWISASSTGTINFSLTNSSNQTLTYNDTYTNTSGTWKYYEWKLPVGAMGPSFKIAFTSSVNIGIDDILFYPENAEAGTFAYDANFNKTAVTNTNGVSSYYAYDAWSRLLFAYDQDKNIVQKRTYVTPVDYLNFANSNSFGISGAPQNNEGGFYPNNPITFSTHFLSACLTTGISYLWTFGDGQTLTTASTTVTHTYTSTGTYTATLQTTSPFLGQETAPAKTIVISNNVDVVAGNHTVGTGIDDVDFYQGSTLIYHFTAAQLGAGVTVPRGVYNIIVTTHGPVYLDHVGTGFLSIVLTDDVTTSCQGYLSGNSYTFSTVDLSQCSSVHFNLYITNCTF